MSKKILKLSEVDIDSLDLSAGVLIPMLEEQSNTMRLKTTAFVYNSPRTKEIFHVQVIVTRDKTEFLDECKKEEITDKILGSFRSDSSDSIVIRNMMSVPDYTPYCGNNKARHLLDGCDNPRTRFSFLKGQFVCSKCGWQSSFTKDVIEKYKQFNNY